MSSLLPILLEELVHPTRILDQHFGLTLDPNDLYSPVTLPRDLRLASLYPRSYLRPWRTSTSAQDVGSTVQMDKEKFQANLDVQQFKPEELTVRVDSDNTVIIEGKHEEKQDEHGLIFRHFIRKYTIPKTCDITKLESRLSSDGVLSILAPKMQENAKEINIPITQTGKPAKTDTCKKSEPSGAGDNKAEG
ncbi:protein lethal(2)essential for life-like [Coccinella septempunctata]|uniref:protein lethal(2)essential for life-like n=1 Tax=Coccinella septempunctata TaxID=41139 RepID=UPI001D096E76|nr:protein lethal(2)essential for life-like [Coccinella septempunctata]